MSHRLFPFSSQISGPKPSDSGSELLIMVRIFRKIEKTAFMFSNFFSIFWNFNFPQSTSTFCQHVCYSTTYSCFCPRKVFTFITCTVIYKQRICWNQQTYAKKYDWYDEKTFMWFSYIIIYVRINKKVKTTLRIKGELPKLSKTGTVDCKISM